MALYAILTNDKLTLRVSWVVLEGVPDLVYLVAIYRVFNIKCQPAPLGVSNAYRTVCGKRAYVDTDYTLV